MSSSKFIYHGAEDKDFDLERKKHGLTRSDSFVIKDGSIYEKEKYLGGGGFGFAYLFSEKNTAKKLVIKTQTSLIHQPKKNQKITEEKVDQLQKDVVKEEEHEKEQKKKLDERNEYFFQQVLEKCQHEQEILKFISHNKYGDIHGDKIRSITSTWRNEVNSAKRYAIRLTMEYVEGETFKNYIEKIKDPLELLKLMIDIIRETRRFRYQLKVIHGDPNQNNIIVNAGKVKLINYGESTIIDNDLSNDFMDYALSKEMVYFRHLVKTAVEHCEKNTPALAPFLKDLSLGWDDRSKSVDDALPKLVKIYRKFEKSKDPILSDVEPSVASTGPTFSEEKTKNPYELFAFLDVHGYDDETIDTITLLCKDDLANFNFLLNEKINQRENFDYFASKIIKKTLKRIDDPITIIEMVEKLNIIFSKSVSKISLDYKIEAKKQILELGKTHPIPKDHPAHDAIKKFLISSDSMLSMLLGGIIFHTNYYQQYLEVCQLTEKAIKVITNLHSTGRVIYD